MFNHTPTPTPKPPPPHPPPLPPPPPPPPRPHLLHARRTLDVLAGGGSDESTNLRTLCARCNEEKSNRFTADVRAARPRLIVAYCFDGNEVIHLQQALAVVAWRWRGVA